MTRLAPLALALIGCASIPDGARPLSAVDYRAALAAWQQAGQPLGRCNDVDVLVVTVRDTKPLCYADVNGCLTSVAPGFMGSGGYFKLIVQSYDYAGPKLLAHELAHLFVLCGHRRRDDLHKMPGVWDSAAGPGVESDVAGVLKP